MSEENKKRLFTITGVRRVEEGLEFDFDLSDEFIEKFKEEQGLKKWSQPRFDVWVTENIEAIKALAGLSTTSPEETEE